MMFYLKTGSLFQFLDQKNIGLDTKTRPKDEKNGQVIAKNAFLLPERRPSWISHIFVSPERMFVGTHSDSNSVCPCVRPSVRPLKFRLTFFKLLLFEQVRFNYNQTWIICALWEPSHYDALGGHMTRSKVT